jgi:hypothetical protein
MDVEKLIEGHFAGELDDKQEAELRAALAKNEAHREAYDQRAKLLRLLAANEPTESEKQALWSRLETALDDPARATRRAAPEQQAARIWFRWLPVFGTIVLVGLVALVALRVGDRDAEKPVVQMRGGQDGSPRAKDGGAPVHDGSKQGKLSPIEGAAAFEIFGIGARAQGGFEKPRRVGSGEALDVATDFIQFRYKLTQQGVRYLYLAAVAQSGAKKSAVKRTRLYYPRQNAGLLTIEPSARMKAIGRSIRLAVRHDVGALRIVAVFSQTAVSREKALSLISKIGARRQTRIDGWPGTHHVVEHRYSLLSTVSANPPSLFGQPPKTPPGQKDPSR